MPARILIREETEKPDNFENASFIVAAPLHFSSKARRFPGRGKKIVVVPTLFVVHHTSDLPLPLTFI